MRNILILLLSLFSGRGEVMLKRLRIVAGGTIYLVLAIICYFFTLLFGGGAIILYLSHSTDLASAAFWMSLIYLLVGLLLAGAGLSRIR